MYVSIWRGYIRCYFAATVLWLLGLLYCQQYDDPFHLFITNPNYLLQEKLQYEVCVRGISSGSDL